MKMLYTATSILGVSLSCFVFFSCEKPIGSDDSSEPTASEAMQKVETAYYEGAEKNENAPKKDMQVRASQEYLDQVLKEGAEHYVNFNSRYNRLRDVSGAGYDVGVIPTFSGCPLSSELVTLYLDCEDDSPHNSGYTSSTGTPELTGMSTWFADGNGNVKMYFCKADGRLFSDAGGRFDVLKLGVNNPSNWESVRFLHLDNEDHKGTTRFETTRSNALPNYVDGNRNANLYWIAFNNSGSGTFPDLGFSYSVLGPNNGSTPLIAGVFFTDDEDGNSGNSMSVVEGSGALTDGDFAFYYKPVWVGGAQITGTRFWMKRVR